ncbi:MAG: Hsp20/alpha crystallin family protein [Opitutales bacterium]
MNLIKYDDFFNDPIAEMDRFLNRAFGGRVPSVFNAENAQSFRMDVYDDEHNYYVVAELPGVTRDDVNVQLENAVLTISGERKEQEGEQEHTYKFSRTVTVSDDVDPEKVSAKLEDGLLRVTLPKAESRKPKAITVG